MTLTIKATAGTSDIDIIVVGHAAVEAPDVVAAEAARLEESDVTALVVVVVGDQRFGLIRPQDQAWYTGTEEMADAWSFTPSRVAPSQAINCDLGL